MPADLTFAGASARLFLCFLFTIWSGTTLAEPRFDYQILNSGIVVGSTDAIVVRARVTNTSTDGEDINTSSWNCICGAGIGGVVPYTIDTRWDDPGFSLRPGDFVDVDLLVLTPQNPSVPDRDYSVNTHLTLTYPVFDSSNIHVRNETLTVQRNFAWTAGVPPLSSPADLAIGQFHSPDQVKIGDVFSYRILVHNYGSGHAPNTIVTDILPPTLSVNSITTTKGSCTGSTQIDCNLGTLRAHETAGIDIVVKANARGIIRNSVAVGSRADDSDPGNNQIIARTFVDPLPTTSLGDPIEHLKVTVATTVTDSGLDYGIDITNMGPKIHFLSVTASGRYSSATTNRGHCDIEYKRSCTGWSCSTVAVSAWCHLENSNPNVYALPTGGTAVINFRGRLTSPAPASFWRGVGAGGRRPAMLDNNIDGDGIHGTADNCTWDPNPDQSDVDGDGMGDACDVDGDGDGHEDATWDNCPLIGNPSQTDTDNDGVGNACDNDDDGDGTDDGIDLCPLIAIHSPVDADGDGMGDICDFDDDNDGVWEPADNCPFIANVDQTNTDGDTLGNACDPDDDNDGISDAFEKAHGLDPFKSEDASEDWDGDGFTNLQEFEVGTDPNDSGSNAATVIVPILQMLLEE